MIVVNDPSSNNNNNNCDFLFEPTVDKITILYIDTFDIYEELYVKNQNIGPLCSPK